MKTLMKILTSGLMVLALLLTSCEKSEAETELPIEESQEEGFTSKTGNNDSAIELPKEVMSPILHERYDASLSREEAEALFEIEVSKFVKKNGNSNRSASYFNFRVATLTGHFTNSETDGNVWARVNFLTDKGYKYLPWFRLNNEGDDREKGAWDFYYFGTHASSINWLEVKNATLALQGMDGWYVAGLFIDAYTASSSGATSIFSNPRIWLDNETSGGWDFHFTGNIGTGRVTF